MFWKIEEFVADFAKKHGPFNEVLDVGSFDINGSVKHALPGTKVFGIDMREGPGVDMVLNGHDLLYQSGFWHRFDLITCCETLEHDNLFWVTVNGMREILKPGGWLLITTPGINFIPHNFPSDYYRFTVSAYKDFMFREYEEFVIEEYADKADPVREKPNNTILAYGRKPL